MELSNQDVTAYPIWSKTFQNDNEKDLRILVLEQEVIELKERLEKLESFMKLTGDE